MGKKLHNLEIRGYRHLWGIDVMADPKHVADWQADGLNVTETLNTIPEWVVDLGLVRMWCLFQDLFNFKRPQ